MTAKRRRKKRVYACIYHPAGITAIAAIFTYILPAGQYDMVEGLGGRRKPVDPGYDACFCHI